MAKRSVFSTIADTYGLPVRVVELMHGKGVITDRMTDSDKEFLFKYKLLWLNMQLLRAQVRRLNGKFRAELFESTNLPEMSQSEKWAYSRWYKILEDTDHIPPRVYKIAEEIQLHFKIKDYTFAEEIAKRMKKVAYDRIRHEKRQARGKDGTEA